MMLIRPINQSDLNDLEKLAVAAEPGLTSLPDNKDNLRHKIKQSLSAFDEGVHKPGGESYVFVLEDTENKKIVGLSGIVSKVGGFEPYYTYQIKTEHYSDPDLKIDQDIKVLHLLINHDGPTEICSLFISPKYRRGGLGRLLSLCRFLFMVEFSERFEKNVISEMRGFTNDKGKSPFWEYVGKHFFETDFSVADFLSGLGHKSFIKNLMPKYPIYIPMLPKSVQKIIGKVHKKTEPALHLLLKEGFEYDDQVDIFDAGPTVAARLDKIRTVDESVKTSVAEIITDPIQSEEYIISNTKLDFRACLGPIKKNDDGTISLGKEIAELLNVTKGDDIRFVTPR